MHPTGNPNQGQNWQSPHFYGPRELDPTVLHDKSLNERTIGYLESNLPNIDTQPGGPRNDQLALIAGVYGIAGSQAYNTLMQRAATPGSHDIDGYSVLRVANLLVTPGQFPTKELRTLLDTAHDKELVTLCIADAMIQRFNVASQYEEELVSLPTAFNGITRLLGDKHAAILRAYYFGTSRPQHAKRLGQIVAAEERENAARLAEQQLRLEQARQQANDRERRRYERQQDITLQEEILRAHQQAARDAAKATAAINELLNMARAGRGPQPEEKTSTAPGDSTDRKEAKQDTGPHAPRQLPSVKVWEVPNEPAKPPQHGGPAKPLEPEE